MAADRWHPADDDDRGRRSCGRTDALGVELGPGNGVFDDLSPP
jgi:hypothetical protein